MGAIKYVSYTSTNPNLVRAHRLRRTMCDKKKSMSENKLFEPQGSPDWGLLDCLDPVQLGFIYESLMNNANDVGLNAKSAKDYLGFAEVIKEAIDANCGFEDYVKHQQKLARKLADYDGRYGFLQENE